MLKKFYKYGVAEAGCDEAGRGCLAGPVYAAAVILSTDFSNDLLRDSKLLGPGDRESLRKIIEKEAVAWAVASLDNNEIDRINILQASVRAMHLALAQLNRQPEHLLIDGNYFHPYKKIKHQCIIKGDDLYLSIAAASVLAKTHRDEFMRKLHDEYPHYGWFNNKGYATAGHRRAIMEYGTSPYHRKSFNQNFQMNLDL